LFRWIFLLNFIRIIMQLKFINDMKESNQVKEYSSPLFRFVIRNEQNKVFFTASGGGSDSVSGSITSMSSTTATAW